MTIEIVNSDSEVLSVAGTSITLEDFEPGAGGNRVLKVGLMLNATTATTPTDGAATFGGVAMSLVELLASGANYVGLFVLPEGDWPETPADIVCTWTTTSGAVLTAVVLEGIDQDDPVGTPNTNGGTSTAPSVEAVCLDGEYLVGVLQVASIATDTVVPTAPYAEIIEDYSPAVNGTVRGELCSGVADGDDDTIPWTLNVSRPWLAIAVPINEASEPPAGNTTDFFHFF